MKKFRPFIIIVLALISGCDSPRSQRANNTNSGFNSSGSSNGFTSSGNIATIDLNNNNSPTIATTSTTTGTLSVVPTDASQCKFSSDGVTNFDSTSTHLGQYTLCQSTADKNIVYFQLQTPPVNNNGDVSICLIPTTSSGSNSIHIGNPMCGFFSDPKAIRKITFVKYAQYANATMTGVIFFKDLKWIYPTFYNYTYVNGAPQYYPIYNNYINTLDAYKLCMSMLADINNSSNCTYFKNVGQYVYKQF